MRIYHNKGELSRLMLVIWIRVFRALFLYSMVVVSLWNWFSAETRLTMQPSESTALSGRFYEGDTEMTSCGLDQGLSINANQGECLRR